ncbi:MAG TPA: DUF998 domain-containing protein [Terriglobia bacterium]|nr:DUF998 domain-containing protein [Terriglobia bacterium]
MVFEYATIVFAAIFFAILILLHFLKREFDPTWRMISEYEIGRFGWMMRIAFFCWGASTLALLITIWPSLGSISGTISRGWLVLIVIAQFGAGIFKTNPITETAPNPTNTLHTLFGMIVILTFPIVASLAVHSLLQNDIWLPSQGQLIFGTVLVWIGLIAYFASIIISRIIDPSVERVGPKVYQGWPNRFMAATYVIWLILIAGNALRFL